jgi:hypothetical protein
VRCQQHRRDSTLADPGARYDEWRFPRRMGEKASSAAGGRPLILYQCPTRNTLSRKSSRHLLATRLQP